MLDNLLLLANDDIPDNLGVGLNWDFFPFMPQLREAAGAIQATMLIILGVVLIVAGVAWACSRAMSSQTAQRVTSTAIVVCVVAAIIVGGAFGLIVWAAGGIAPGLFGIGS